MYVTKYLTVVFAVCVSFTKAANKEDNAENKIEDTTDPNTRNARYITAFHGNPYYNTGYPNSYIPPRDYYYPDRNNYYPTGNTHFYPVDRYPNKYNPSYWLNKLPGFGSGGGNYNPGYPQPNYPGQYPGGGTNFIGYFTPNRQPGYPTAGYPTAGYPTAGYPTAGYPTAGYPTTGYSGIGNGGYGGYQGNGGLYSYSGYDGYDAAGNRPGNTGFGYQHSRTGGSVLPVNRFPSYPSIVTPSSVSKDA